MKNKFMFVIDMLLFLGITYTCVSLWSYSPFWFTVTPLAMLVYLWQRRKYWT